MNYASDTCNSEIDAELNHSRLGLIAVFLLDMS